MQYAVPTSRYERLFATRHTLPRLDRPNTFYQQFLTLSPSIIIITERQAYSSMCICDSKSSSSPGVALYHYLQVGTAIPTTTILIIFLGCICFTRDLNRVFCFLVCRYSREERRRDGERLLIPREIWTWIWSFIFAIRWESEEDLQLD